MTKVNEVLKKRIDVHTSAPSNGLLEFQSAVQGGYVVDITNRGGVACRGLHIFLELIKATPLEVTPVVEEEVVVVEEVTPLETKEEEEVVVDAPKEAPTQTTPKRNTAKKSTTEDVKEDAK